MSAAQHPPGSVWANPEWAFEAMERTFSAIGGGSLCLLTSAESSNEPCLFKFIARGIEKELDNLRAEIRKALNLPAEEIDE